MSSYEGKRALVVGLGVSGQAAARALQAAGAMVVVTEASGAAAVQARAEGLTAAGIEVELGGHSSAAGDFDLAVISPGIPPHAAIVSRLRARGIEMISEIELGWSLARCDILAVTGTNGKTTTTELLARMLERAGVQSMAAGNIGTPLSEAVAQIAERGAIAAEVSSFQLALTRDFKPKVAVVLNVAEDHTDWHHDSAAYAAAKGLISANQNGGDILVFNREDARCREIAARSRAYPVAFSALSAPEDGIGISEGKVYFKQQSLMDAAELSLPGRAGTDDILAAAAAALCYGLDRHSVVEIARSFRASHHRLETVGSLDGVMFIDDSKATNPHATLAALEGMEEVVLIAGGRSKGIDLRVLQASVPPVVSVVALGEAAEEIKAVFEGLVPVIVESSMQRAVERAFAATRGRGSVLLSPSCASLDMYESYAARGDDFKRAVASLREKRMTIESVRPH